jgi:hypothetical protein
MLCPAKLHGSRPDSEAGGSAWILALAAYPC